VKYIAERNLEIPFVIDTHAHADHLTAMPFFKKRFGARTVTGSRVGEVQKIFHDIYNLGFDFAADGRHKGSESSATDWTLAGLSFSHRW